MKCRWSRLFYMRAKTFHRDTFRLQNNPRNPRIAKPSGCMFTMRRFTLLCLLCAAMSEACKNDMVYDIGVPPKNSQNITCVTRLNKGLTCYWDLQSNSTNKQYNVSLMSYRNISDTTTDNCYFFKNLGMGSPVTVSVTTNSSKEEMEYNNLYSTVKYEPPNRVWTEAYSDSIRVNWENDEDITFTEYFKCEVQVLQEAPQIKRVWKTTEDRKAPNTMAATMAVTFNITHVKPCFNYTASVRCAYDESWSPWSEWKSNTTFLPLSIDSIVLHLWRRVLELGKDGRGAVDLMWKGPPLVCHAIDEYRIFIDYNVTEHLPPSKNYFQLQASHNPTVAQEVVIAAYKNGTMLSNDSVRIPSVAQESGGPPVKQVWTTNDDGQILVSWEAPLVNVSSYVVVYYTNESVSTWLQTQETNLSFPGVPKSLHTIIVTPLYGDTPGNDRTLYMYTEEGSPAQVTGVQVTDVEDTWARVEWDAVSPDQCCGFVLNYTVFCVFTGTQQLELNVTVESREDSVRLTNLKPSTEYSVHVMASSIAGSSKSSSANFKTKQFGKGFVITMILFALGALLLMIILLSILILLRKIKFHKVPNPGLSSVGQWTQQDSKEISSPWGISPYRDQNMACDLSTLENILPVQCDIEEPQLSNPQVCADMTMGYESFKPISSTRAADLQTPDDTPANRGQTITGFRDVAMPKRHSDAPSLEQVLNYISVETGQTLACAVGNQGSLSKTKTVNSIGQTGAGLMGMATPRRHSDEPSLEQVLNYISVETGQTLACSVLKQGSSPETKTAKPETGEKSTLTTNLSYMTADACRQLNQMNF